jgi:hypothetical protein
MRTHPLKEFYLRNAIALKNPRLRKGDRIFIKNTLPLSKIALWSCGFQIDSNGTQFRRRLARVRSIGT